MSDYINQIKDRQTERVEKILEEHPRFMTIVSAPSEFSESLDLSTQSEEDIYLELSRALIRQEKKVRRKYAQNKKSVDDISTSARQFAKELKKESLASLAEYVYKRKLILDVFQERISFVDIDAKRHELEEVVHELICPLGQSKEDMSYDDHNLWVVDDELAFYSYFNSDRTLKKSSGSATDSTKEPDITFFDIGIGLERGGTQEPVSIIEFKKPGRENYSLTDNPFVQIREYCSKIREAGRIVSHAGTELRSISKDTPFHGHIIADITPRLREMMKQFGPYSQKSGKNCYYKWDEDFSMFIQIQSYQDVLTGAKLRNEAFFQKLGI